MKIRFMNILYILPFLMFFLYSGLHAGSTIELTHQEKSWIRQHPVIRLGSLKHYPPLAFEDRQSEGWAEDYNRLINEKTGLNIELVHDDWMKSVKAANNGQLEGLFPAIINLRILSPTHSFSKVTTSSYIFVYTLISDKSSFKKIADLKGKKVAYQQGISHIKELLQAETTIKAQTYPTQSELLSALLESEVDAVLGNVNLEYEINTRMLPVKMALVLKDHPAEAGYAISKSQPLLLSIINKGIDAISEEEQSALFRKWHLQHLVQDPPLVLSKAEKAWLKQHPEISVGSDPFWDPIEYRDNKGEFHGIAIDYLRRIENMLGVRFIIDKKSTWQQLILKAKNNQIDMFSCLALTEERKAFVNFTTPYITFPVKIFTRHDTAYIAGPKDLAGLKVAVVESYSFHYMLQQDYPDIELVTVSTIEGGLEKLQRGEVVAFIGNLLATGQIISKKGFSTIKVGGDTPYSNTLGMASRKDWPILRDILQKALNNIPPSERIEIYQKWVPIIMQKQNDYSLLWKIGIPLLLILFGFIIWNRQLKHQVTLRTNELKQNEFYLHQARKMEAIGQLAGGIAHDFNNILAGIIGYTELSLMDAAEDSVQAQNLRQVLIASERAKNLVSQILTFSRHSDTSRLPIMLEPVIKEVLNLVRVSTPSTVQITTELQPDTRPVLADSSKIHEMMLNLTTNAIQAMKNKGHLSVSLKELNIIKELEGRLGKIQPGYYSILEIRDDGRGMNADVLEKIFEPFFTTKGTGQGTGMGLAVVYGILLSHKGNIIVESTPGIGSVFRVYLPKTNISHPESARADKPARGGKERVLFVDDEDSIITTGSALLSSLGYDVYSTSSSLEALEMIKNDPDRFDLIITDQTMPEMTGLELSKYAHEIREKLPVLLCTGYSSDISENELLKNGVSKLCLKPLSKQEYALAIREVLEN